MAQPVVECEMHCVHEDSADQGLGGPNPDLKLRMVFTFLKVVKSKQRKKKEYMTETICGP